MEWSIGERTKQGHRAAIYHCFSVDSLEYAAAGKMPVEEFRVDEVIISRSHALGFSLH